MSGYEDQPILPAYKGFQKWIKLSVDDFPLIRPPRQHMLANITGGLMHLYEVVTDDKKNGKSKSDNENIKNGNSKDVDKRDKVETKKRDDEGGGCDLMDDEEEETSPYTNEEGEFVPDSTIPLLASRYKYIEVIAHGQSATIIKALDTFAKDKPIAIKVLHRVYKPIGSQEADILLELHRADPWLHVPFARLQNQFVYGPHYCLVFDFLCPTEQRSIKDPSSLPNVRNLCVKLLTVLGFLHKQNVIHADLKPENILLVEEKDSSSVMVIDFGNALRNTEEELSVYYSDYELQTLLYRAPEVIFGLKLGLEIDMWSLGCLLAECYTGEPLFIGQTKQDILVKVTEVLGPLPEEFLGGDYADMFSEFIGKPLSRYQRVENLRRKLNNCQDTNFLHILETFLTYSPGKRPSPFESACHPFVATVSPFLFLVPKLEQKRYPGVLLDETTYPYLPIKTDESSLSKEANELNKRLAAYAHSQLVNDHSKDTDKKTVEETNINNQAESAQEQRDGSESSIVNSKKPLSQPPSPSSTSEQSPLSAPVNNSSTAPPVSSSVTVTPQISPCEERADSSPSKESDTEKSEMIEETPDPGHPIHRPIPTMPTRKEESFYSQKDEPASKNNANSSIEDVDPSEEDFRSSKEDLRTSKKDSRTNKVDGMRSKARRQSSDSNSNRTDIKGDPNFTRTDVKQTLKSMGLRCEDFTISVYSKEQAHAILRKQGVEVTNHAPPKKPQPRPPLPIQRPQSMRPRHNPHLNPYIRSMPGIVRPMPRPRPNFNPPAPAPKKAVPEDDDDDDDDCVILDPPEGAPPKPPPKPRPQPRRYPQQFQLMGTTVQVNRGRGSKRPMRGMSHAPRSKRQHQLPPRHYSYNENYDDSSETSVQDTLKRLKNYNISITCRRNAVPSRQPRMRHPMDSDSDMDYDGAHYDSEEEEEDMARFLECEIDEEERMHMEHDEYLDLDSSGSLKDYCVDDGRRKKFNKNNHPPIKRRPQLTSNKENLDSTVELEGEEEGKEENKEKDKNKGNLSKKQKDGSPFNGENNEDEDEEEAENFDNEEKDQFYPNGDHSQNKDNEDVTKDEDQPQSEESESQKKVSEETEKKTPHKELKETKNEEPQKDPEAKSQDKPSDSNISKPETSETTPQKEEDDETATQRLNQPTESETDPLDLKQPPEDAAEQNKIDECDKSKDLTDDPHLTEHDDKDVCDNLDDDINEELEKQLLEAANLEDDEFEGEDMEGLDLDNEI